MMRGFTLVELLVALVLFSLASLALGRTLLETQRAQSESGRWMRAASLADEALERARLVGGDGGDQVGAFRRRWSSSDEAGLRRIEVTVEWGEPAARQIRLSTWVRP